MTPPEERRRNSVVVASLLAAFATNLTLTILTIAVQPIADAFGATAAEASWITIAPSVVSALLIPAAARAADTYGRKRVWLLGFGLSTFAIALSGAAWSLPVLVVARILNGVGSAAVFPAGLAIAASVFPPAERRIPVGLWTSVLALSPAVGVVLGGLVIEHLSWRWLFHVQLPFAIGALVLAAVVFEDHRAPPGERFDVAGAVLAALASFALLVGFNRGAAWGWTSVPTLLAFAAAAVLFPAFLHVERRAASPVVPLPLFADPAIAWGIVSRSLLNGIYMGAFLVLPLWLLGVAHYTAGAVAMTLLPRPLAMGIAGPLAGNVAHPRHLGALAIAGGVTITIPLVYFASMTRDFSYLALTAALVLQGVGLALVQTATATVVASRVDEESLATASGVLSITTSLANAMGMAFMLALVELAGGTADEDAYRFSYAVGAVLAAIGTLGAVAFARSLRTSR